MLQNTVLQSLTTAFTNVLNSTSHPTVNNNEPWEKSTQAVGTIATQLHQHQTQTSPITNVSETIPEYRPTPIAELERRKRIQQQTDWSNIKTGDIYLVKIYKSIKTKIFLLSRSSGF